ncbi:1-acyl-sn-glycerol-3-phosphate acyltransferase [bacterium]|nr:1-acyl-sn-glycerol-3-phosphate acyltransferase [bacterium]
MKYAYRRPGYRFIQFVVRWYYKIVFGMKVVGIENIPLEGPLIVACNHRTLSEPPMVGSVVPREMYFAAKQQLLVGPLGVILRYANAIPIRRTGSDKEAIKALAASLKEGKAVLIFPEGTRTLNPDDAKIKAGVGMLAMMGGADVMPVRVDGTGRTPWSIFHRGTMKITFGKVVRLSEVLDEELPRREAYHLIAQRVMSHIRAL